MSTLAKRLTCVAAAMAFAVAMLFTGTLAFGGEATLQQLQEVMANLYPNATIVNQDVYGVIADEYAVAVTETTFDGGTDAALDIIKSDGTTKFHTSEATTKLAGDEVWSDYSFNNYADTVGSNLSDKGCTSVYNKNTSKYGAVNLEGQAVINYDYDAVRLSSVAHYGCKLNGENWDVTFFDPDTYTALKTVSIKKGSYDSAPYAVSIFNYLYFSVYDSSTSTSTKYFYKYENGTITECTDITDMSYSSNDYSSLLKE